MKVSRAITLFLVAITMNAFSQDMTVTGGEAAEGLDLQAVGELFRKSSNSEDFEAKLNDQNSGINNLDLDGNERF